MYVMEFAIPRCGWNCTQIFKKWPHSELKLSFFLPYYFFPQKCFMEGNTPIILLVTMNTVLMWQFECCQEQKSLAFKIGMKIMLPMLILDNSKHKISIKVNKGMLAWYLFF